MDKSIRKMRENANALFLLGIFALLGFLVGLYQGEPKGSFHVGLMTGYKKFNEMKLKCKGPILDMQQFQLCNDENDRLIRFIDPTRSQINSMIDDPVE